MVELGPDLICPYSAWWFVGRRGGDLNVAQVHAGIEHRGDEGMSGHVRAVVMVTAVAGYSILVYLRREVAELPDEACDAVDPVGRAVRGEIGWDRKLHVTIGWLACSGATPYSSEKTTSPVGAYTPWKSRPTPIRPVVRLKPVGPGPGGSEMTAATPSHSPTSKIQFGLFPRAAEAGLDADSLATSAPVAGLVRPPLGE